jgi:hypothetical protein
MVNLSRFLPALIGLACFLNPAQANDLAKIDRTIGKEPPYRSKPKYCLLVFGPEAKTRVWLVQDGDVLYVDRTGNGDLTENDKKVTSAGSEGEVRQFQAGDIRDGELKHTGLAVVQMRASAELVGDAAEFKRISSQNPEPWIWTVGVTAERASGPADPSKLPKQIKYIANGDGLGYLLFADRPQDAPVIHFNGPWTLGLQDIRQRFTPGQQANLQIGVGTQGVGPGTFSFVLYPGLIPNDAYPVAEITFPPKGPEQKPPRDKFTLKRRC